MENILMKGHFEDINQTFFSVNTYDLNFMYLLANFHRNWVQDNKIKTQTFVV